MGGVKPVREEGGRAKTDVEADGGRRPGSWGLADASQTDYAVWRGAYERLAVAYKKGELAAILNRIDLGSSVAEQDDLLESARVETSVFSDLLQDRVDLVSGTKGSGKSALYRIFVDFLAASLLEKRKVVVAHGVQSHGDNVFLAFKDRFEALSEDDFVDFWCIYLVSLAHEQFVKGRDYAQYLRDCGDQVEAFRRACYSARIPEIEAQRSLRDVLDWALNALGRLKPRVSLTVPDGTRIDLGLFTDQAPQQLQTNDVEDKSLPRYIGDVKDTLEAILVKADLSLWLMVDRLDEIFPRRSALETRALRGLLRTLRIFESRSIRIKVFLRDDILEQVTSSGQGFTALTHITARQSDTLRWTEDGILTLIVNRLAHSNGLVRLLGVDRDQLSASARSRERFFYCVFPGTVNAGPNQSSTLRWIYSHTADGRGVVTPRDVIDLLTKAKQRQQDEFQSDANGLSEWVIGSSAIRYGHAEMSARKRDTVLKAELPHLWPHIEKLVGGKTEFSDRALLEILGPGSQSVINDLVNIGLLAPNRHRNGQISYKIPFLYRDGLELTQGRVD